MCNNSIKMKKVCLIIEKVEIPDFKEIKGGKDEKKW